MSDPTAPQDHTRTYPQMLKKRVRIRKCGATLGMGMLIYSEGRHESVVVFTCQKEKHENTELHYERGYVKYPNGTSREYTITWKDDGIVTFR